MYFVWAPTGTPSQTAHAWEGSDTICATCNAAYHCPACGDKCPSEGHLLTDERGSFLGCQDVERRNRLFAVSIAA